MLTAGVIGEGLYRYYGLWLCDNRRRRRVGHYNGHRFAPARRWPSPRPEPEMLCSCPAQARLLRERVATARLAGRRDSDGRRVTLQKLDGGKLGARLIVGEGCELERNDEADRRVV